VEGRYPIQHGVYLEVSFDDGVHFGAVDNRLALGMIAHLLLGEGGTEDVLGQLLSPRLVLAVNAHLVMNTKARVPPS